MGRYCMVKINRDFIHGTSSLFFSLPPHALLSSRQSSRCGFRTEEPNSAGMREPCWPIKTLPSSNPTQEMWLLWSSPSYLVLPQDPLIISPGELPLRTGEWLAHSPLLRFHTFLSGWSRLKLLVQLADISYWVNLFRDIQLADIPRFSQEITSCPRSRVWGRRERGRPSAISSWTQELLQRFQRWGRISKKRSLSYAQSPSCNHSGTKLHSISKSDRLVWLYASRNLTCKALSVGPKANFTIKLILNEKKRSKEGKKEGERQRKTERERRGKKPKIIQITFMAIVLC